MSKFNLSSKICKGTTTLRPIDVEDVKEFIRLLKEEMKFEKGKLKSFDMIINKLAGEELI